MYLIPLPPYLQAKIQKHQAFEAEVAAHSNAIVVLDNTGMEMINQGHFQQSSIRGTSKMPTFDHFCPLLTHFFICHFSSFRRIASIVGTFVEETV